MRRRLASVIFSACVVLANACGGTTTSPSSVTSATATIGFSGLSGLPCSGLTPSPDPSCILSSYTEAGFTGSTISGDWSVRTDFGSPAPFIQFWASPGTTVGGEIRITTAGTSPFYFKSVDLYSSITPIPYVISGVRNGSTIFTMADTLPNTFGRFRTVASQNTADAIDTLSITLTNAPPSCITCRNPMGLDTIVLSSAPTTPPPPTMFSLSGQVSDSATGTAIPGALVRIVDGPNANVATATDTLGNYRFTGLEQSGFTVDVSATNYASQSKGVTLTSNQTLSFQLVHLPPAPAPPAGTTIISFNGLTANSASISRYTESGFTVLPASAAWVAVTTYGNPAPSIQFFGQVGTAVAGEVRVTAGGAVFALKSVDLYSSTSPIPYAITGFRNSARVFALSDTLPNTFGSFKTVVNTNAAAVDTLSIVLTNPAAATVSVCCNPMGLDNIVLSQ